MLIRSQGEAVPPECRAYYNTLNTTSQDTLRIIEKITKNNKNSLSDLRENDPLLAAVCSTMNTQKDAHDHWKAGIESLYAQIKDIPDTTEMTMGGSQKGGADCPENFQKIFNYMFLFAASSSIAIMSPDIKLVTDVCMKALTLTFGTIVLPIINLLRVIFIFMLQSLVLIVKTAAGVAIEIISNFIKTVYLNIHTIASGAIGIAKVFIYKSLTYCGSFYNSVVKAMPIADVEDLKDNNGEQLTEPTIPSTITNLSKEEVGEINKSMNNAVKIELLNRDVVINITEERDIFMDMLTKIGKQYQTVVDTIIFGYNFVKTAYMLLCDKAHTQFKDTLGGAYYSNRVKLYITYVLVKFEKTVFGTIIGVANIPEVTMYYIKALVLKLLKSIWNVKPTLSKRTELGKRKEPDSTSKLKLNEMNDLSKVVPAENVIIQAIGKELEKIDDTNLELALNLKPDDNITTALKTSIESEKINSVSTSIITQINPLVENEDFKKIIDMLDKKLPEMRDMNTPDVIMNSDDDDDDEEPNKKAKTSEGGSKKRRTKKAKKRGNKRGKRVQLCLFKEE
jgi:hypothetical protein